jgi:capsular polysaccharide export protein
MQVGAQPMTDRPARAGCPAQAAPRRLPHAGRPRSVDELFAAAYFYYTRYLNPVTHQRGTIFDVIDWLVRQREMAAGLARIM